MCWRVSQSFRRRESSQQSQTLALKQTNYLNLMTMKNPRPIRISLKLQACWSLTQSSSNFNLMEPTKCLFLEGTTLSTKVWLNQVMSMISWTISKIVTSMNSSQIKIPHQISLKNLQHLEVGSQQMQLKKVERRAILGPTLTCSIISKNQVSKMMEFMKTSFA